MKKAAHRIRLAGMLIALMAIMAVFAGCGGGGSTDNPIIYGPGYPPPIPVPTVTSVSQNLAPGQECTIDGTNFGSARGIRDSNESYVLFVDSSSSTNATQYTYWSDTRIRCIIPVLTPGRSYTVVVTVITSETSASSNVNPTGANNITITPKIPVLSTIKPAIMNQGDTTPLVITGSDFGDTQGTGYIRFGLEIGGTKQSTIISWSSSQISCTVPAAVSTGTFIPVYVITKDGLTSNSLPLDILAAGTPVITAYVSTDKGTSNAKSITVGGSGKIYALFIGINAYPSNALDQCVNDANGMKANLSGSAPWQGAEIVTLLDAAATKAAITSAITSLGAKTGSNDTFFMYYSGHGSGDTSLAYICPVDTDFTAASFISDLELQALLTPIQGKKSIIFDSCHSGGFVGKHPGCKVRYVPVKGQKPGVFTGGGFSKSLSAISNMVFIGAAKGSELSWESSALQHGIFTYYAMEGLGTGTTIGPAAGTGGTFITTQQIWDYSALRAYNYTSTTPGMEPQTAQIQDNSFTGQLIKQ